LAARASAADPAFKPAQWIIAAAAAKANGTGRDHFGQWSRRDLKGDRPRRREEW
jgi:hypothetical protein